MNSSTDEYIRGAIEALLFINEKPITVENLKQLLDNVEAHEVKKYINELKDEYEEAQRGMIIVEIAGGFQMLSRPKYASYIREFYKIRIKERLSRPALETLAIIAYKQPVSRVDIEVIRGVNSDGVVVHLLNKSLIKVVGRKEVPGRPYLYGTTKQFLEYFGLKSLRDLPKLEDFPSLLNVEKSNQEESLEKETAEPQVQEKNVVNENTQEPAKEENQSPKQKEPQQAECVKDVN